ncbi:MAG: tyrosine-protein phosphatase [Trueperaceae bacterium]|jgi:protein-tyrosine phosphatase|nr:tyrosine-protein phosphatase [Truepera sp.]HRN18270.1 tyrosine-protein phosphatase [Trueperaceae bacterium]HRQ10177.1 tyrosine-protein phosphatase [Trueperaceae bacterium]
MASPVTPGSQDARFLTLDGTLNTRDLGGLPVTGDGVTNFGVFFRSDIPMQLGEADFERLSSMGLKTVIDLRQPQELERDPNSLASRAGIDYQNVEIWGHIDAGAQPEDPYDITAFYLRALDHAGGAFVRVMTLLADSPGAALYHCTAGKDRTGLVSALLLEAVGVDRQSIIDDFALTHDRIDPLRQRLLDDAERHGIARHDFERLLGATPDLIGPALDHLDSVFGGAVAYLRSNGLPDDVLERLRHKLTG